MKKYKFYIVTLIMLLLTACSTTKNIPKGEYLLNSITVKHDTHNSTATLETFVRQQPNTSIPLVGKVRLKIYNLVKSDTSKWFNRTIMKIGKAPVIYNERLTDISAQQLKKELNNEGYLHATVDTTLKIKGKKINVKYNIKGGIPYKISNYTYAIEDSTMARIMKVVPLKPMIVKGDYFNMDLLEQERARVNKIMRNVGYYKFSKEYVYFKADTTLKPYQVDLQLSIYPSKDSIPFSRYKLNDITIVSGLMDYNQSNTNSRRNFDGYFRNPDTTVYKEVTIIRGKSNFLGSSTLHGNSYLRQGQNYADYRLTETYEAFNKMEAVKQVNIIVKPSKIDSLKLLDATILLTKANPHKFRMSLDGTNSAGDIGAAPSITYQHQNLFNGAEQLSLKLKGAYEYIGRNSSDTLNLLNQNYYEYGFEAALSFPRFIFPFLNSGWRNKPTSSTKVSMGLTNQFRPEYTREFFNITLNYGWKTTENRMTHALDLLDVNFVRMPWMSPKFKEDYLNNSNNLLLKESYKSQLIQRTSYSFSIINKKRYNNILKPTYVFRAGIEFAGLLPRLIVNGSDSILGVAYAEYIKTSVGYTHTHRFSKKHSLASHSFLGMAYPYGNSKILPFERRFFSGGANSIRGWNTRTLGPGSYKKTNSRDFINQAGDIKLEFSIENRHKINKYFEFAEFIDAGNIWTFNNYDEQKGGKFDFSKFYKEIALSYGAGLRFDFDFLLLRLDLGMRAYDPERDLSERFVLFKPRLSRMAWHFGIGYPF